MSEDFEFSTPEPLPPTRPPVILPWMVAALAILALSVVAVYAKKQLDDQAARAFQATRMADEYGARASKLEADQKDARRQAMGSQEKADELRASNGALADQLKDKEAALAHLQDRHQKLVTDLRAANRSSRGKALNKRIDALLAKDAAAESVPATPATTPTTASRSRARGKRAN
jgi:chromosome segregation ATPase